MSYNRERDLPKKNEAYRLDPQKFRDRKNAAYVSKKTPEQLAKRAEYMRQYYADHPGHKAAADAKYRQKYLEKLRLYDAYRSLSPERKAQKQTAQRKRRSEKSEEVKNYHKAYYEANKSKWEARSRARTARPIEVKRLENRKNTLKYNYGLTTEQYDAMSLGQGGVCAICSEPPRVGFNKRLHVDHDHVTGKVRGLLCMHCNHSIERVEKCPGWATKAEAYLASHR